MILGTYDPVSAGSVNVGTLGDSQGKCIELNKTADS